MATVLGYARRGLTLAVLDALPDATAVVDGLGTILGVNRVWRMFAIDNGGRPEETAVGVNYLQVCTRAAAAGCQDAVEVIDGLRAVLAGQTVDCEVDYQCPSPGGRRWFRVRITPLAGPVRGALVSHLDITRQKMAEQALAHQAGLDPLTGLANRTMFIDRLRTALSPRAARPRRADVGILFLDLDGFTAINQTHGHSHGDGVLAMTAHRLRSTVRVHDTAARLGGDGFAVLAPRIDAAGVAGLATRISAALGAPHVLCGQRLVVPASVGTDLATPGDPVTEVFQRADRALNVVKSGRRHALAPAVSVSGTGR